MLRFRDEAGDAGGEGDAGEAGGEGGTDSLLGGGTGGTTQETAPPPLPEGSFSLKDFKMALPEELRRNEGLGKINTLEDMTRSYLAAQRMIGKDPTNLIELPKADAKLEERLAVLGKLGAPEKADGYKLTLPEGTSPALSEALSLDTEMGKAFLQAAVQHKMLPEQAQAIYGSMAGFFGQAMADIAADTEKDHGTNIAALQTEAGPAFNDWIMAAKFGIDKLGGAPLKAALDEAGLGTNPLVVKAFVQVGKMLAEDSATGTGGTGGRFGALAPAEARARGTELLTRANSEANPVERKRLGVEAQKFFAMANGEK